MIGPNDRTIILDSFLRYPDMRSLPVRIAATALERQIEAVGALGGFHVLGTDLLDWASVPPFNPSKHPRLCDDLTPFLKTGASPMKRLVDRSSREIEAFWAIQGSALTSWTSADEFTDLISETHCYVCDNRHSFRSGGMRTRPDANGNTVIFPPAERIPSLLREIVNRSNELMPSFPGSAAVATYVGLIHCHPFSDGNGRTARTLLNLLLSRAAGAPVCFPISIWSRLCEGSFLIKVRRAMYQDDWSPLIWFVSETLNQLKSARSENSMTRPEWKRKIS